MQVLIFDLETTSLDTATTEIIEIAWVNYDAAFGRLVSGHSFLLRPKEPVTPVIEKITGASQGLLEKVKTDATRAFTEFTNDYMDADVICGHNVINFDLPIVKRYISNLPTKTVIDTRHDLPWDAPPSSNKLSHLLSDFGAVNPFAHQALSDVLGTLLLLSKFPFEMVLKYSLAPTIRIIAKVDYDNREKASSRGFRWDGTIKKWFKECKDFQQEEMTRDLPFAIEIITK